MIVTRSSTTFCPILFLPPGIEKNERPSSAVRALNAPRDELHEIADGRRLEHDGVAARLDRDRIHRASAPSASRARRASTDRCGSSRDASRPPSPIRCRRRAHGRREHGRRRPIVGEQSFVVRDRLRAGDRFHESRRHEPRAPSPDRRCASPRRRASRDRATRWRRSSSTPG